MSNAERRYRDNKITSMETIRFWPQVKNLLFLQSSKILKSPVFYFSLIFFPLFFVVGVGVLIPTASNFSSSMSMVAISVSGIIFADLHFGIEKSTLRKNTNISNYGSKTRLFSIIIITSIVTIVSLLIATLLMMFCETYTNILLTKFVFFSKWSNQNLDVNWRLLPWESIAYYDIIVTLLVISIWVFLRLFIKEYKVFVMVILIYLIVNLIFGGVINGAYSRNLSITDTNIYNGEQMKDPEYQIIEVSGLYSMVKFVTPTYFLNIHFSNILRVGASQNEGVFGWSSKTEFFWNPEVAPVEEWQAYMFDFDNAIKNYIEFGEEIPMQLWATSITVMNPKTQYLKLNGDGYKLFITLDPLIFLAVLTSIGFLSKRR